MPHEPKLITEFYAFVALEPDGGEGLCVVLMGNTWMPAIVADRARVEQLRPLIRQTAMVAGTRIELRRFHQQETLEVIEP